MQAGDVVVLVDDVGIEAGREGQIMDVRDITLMVYRSRERLRLVMAHTWEVLPQELFRRSCARERGLQ